MSEACVFAVRHAPVAVQGICYGQSDVPTQLDALAAGEGILSQLRTSAGAPRIARVWASPWLRTRGPATHVAAALDVPLSIDPRISELAFGAWEGRPYADLEADACFLAWMAAWRDASPPGGERLDALLSRVRDWAVEVRARGEVVVAITHAGVVRALRAEARGVDYAAVMSEAVEPLRVERIWPRSQDV